MLNGYEVTRPVRFPGTPEERTANNASHDFYAAYPDDLPRCLWCDSRYGGVAADYACGTTVPTEKVWIQTSR